MSPLSKPCGKCRKILPLAAFSRHRKTQDGRQHWCKACKLADQDTRRYGMTQVDVGRMLQAQQGVCAICHRPNANGKRLAVDHCHITGNVRGLLCDPCNLSLGKMQDNPDRLRAAAAYLELHASAPLESTH